MCKYMFLRHTYHMRNSKNLPPSKKKIPKFPLPIVVTLMQDRHEDEGVGGAGTFQEWH